MQSTTQNSTSENSLADFVSAVYGDSRFRVDEDLGGGFVRLKISEAERRQAAQDIRSSEDIVIELLRNSRDAGARNIFVAIQKDDRSRTIVVIDDGCGIPQDMLKRVFEPRVTSKLDTAHMDKWGMHGRGMALYSIKQNALEATVKCSLPDGGSSIFVTTNLADIGEKKDQSTFPKFETVDGVHVMRGPKNIVRTAAEFALEHRKTCEVYCGSFAEVLASLHSYGRQTLSPLARAMGDINSARNIAQQLALCADPDSFAEYSANLGLSISARTARRILDGSIEPVDSLMEKLAASSFPSQSVAKSNDRRKHRDSLCNAADSRGFKLSAKDAEELKASIAAIYDQLAESYFLNPDIEPEIRVSSDSIKITIPVEKLL